MAVQLRITADGVVVRTERRGTRRGGRGSEASTGHTGAALRVVVDVGTPVLGGPVPGPLVGPDGTVGVVGCAHGTTSGMWHGRSRTGLRGGAAPNPPIGFGAATAWQAAARPARAPSSGTTPRNRD